MSDNVTLYGASSLSEVGERANDLAGNYILTEFKMRRASNTLRVYKDAINTWDDFLDHVGIIDRGDFFNDLYAWRGLTWGVVEAFKAWMITNGMAINTINAKLSCLRTMAEMAHKAGIIPHEDLTQIQGVKGYYGAEGKHIDNNRDVTRVGTKKRESTEISHEQAAQLKQQPDTPQGYRDRLMICLLLDQGLRVSELVMLQVEDVNIDTGLLTFYRPKVDKQQIHLLSDDAKNAARDYMQEGGISEGILLHSSKKSGELTGGGISRRSITERVKILGERIGLERLSPHDCRHYWATYWAKQDGINPFTLREAGGWNSFASVQKYVRDNRIANKGMVNK